MQIEETKVNDKQGKKEVGQEKPQFEALVDSLLKELTNLNERKSNAEISRLTSLLKKSAVIINREEFVSLLGKSNGIYAMSVIEYMNKPEGVFPSPGSEFEIAIALLASLLFYKQKRYSVCGELLKGLLFDRPHMLAQRAYLEQLTNYIFYKYLNCIEFSNNFTNTKADLFAQLRELQSSKNEVLFCTLYVFVLRNLLKENRLKEAHQMLKNFSFTENIQYIYYSKYLFYKGLFMSRVGKYQVAFSLMNNALRKAPESKNDKRCGLYNFSILIQKHIVVLSLLLNELPSVETFAGKPKLSLYKELVRLVTQGRNEEFNKLRSDNSRSFERDMVLDLLTKMEPVVLRNAVKKLSITYTRINIPDVLKKMGIRDKDSFDIQSFLTKSKDYIEEFKIDPQNNLIDFAKTSESYSDASIREALGKRIHHLNAMDEQITKSLRYPEQKEPMKKEDDSEDIDLDDLSLDDLII